MSDDPVLHAELDRLRSELTRTQEEARAASSDRTRFLAAASHDLLQPLNAARLYASSLMDQAQGTQFAGLAGMIETSLQAVEEIMGSLLDVARLDSGAIAPAVSAFAIGDVLEKVSGEFAPLAAEKGVTLTVVTSSAHVLSDPVIIGRIVRNLVSNAIKYTPAAGRVLVGTRRTTGALRIDVIDTGIGIANAQQELVFAEFTRLEPGTRLARGLGLGLSIVRRLAEALGLSVELASAPDKGSRFSVSAIPLAPLRPTASPPPARSADPIELRVLCVDNEASVLGGMEQLLGGWGCDVRTAPSLKSVTDRRLLDVWMPDLVLMDFHLDQTSGLDAIEWLHQNFGAHLPAALLTADRSEGVARLAASRDVPVLHKPIRPAALRALLAAVKSGTWVQAGRDAATASS